MATSALRRAARARSIATVARTAQGQRRAGRSASFPRRFTPKRPRNASPRSAAQQRRRAHGSILPTCGAVRCRLGSVRPIAAAPPGGDLAPPPTRPPAPVSTHPRSPAGRSRHVATSPCPPPRPPVSVRERPPRKALPPFRHVAPSGPLPSAIERDASARPAMYAPPATPTRAPPSQDNENAPRRAGQQHRKTSVKCAMSAVDSFSYLRPQRLGYRGASMIVPPHTLRGRVRRSGNTGAH